MDSVRETMTMLDIPGLAFNGTCTFTTNTGALALTLATSDRVIVGRDSGNGNIAVNGNSTTCQNANYLNLKLLTITIAGSATGTGETVVLDYSNGSFGLSAGTTNTGTLIDLGGDSGTINDFISIRTQDSNTLNQNITVGAHGIYLSASNWNDILLTGGHNPNWLTLALGAGNDIVHAAGTAALGGPAAQALTVYGNNGADVFYTSGSNFNDIYAGGNGNDMIYVAAAVSTGHQTYDGVAGQDTVDFSSRALATKLYNNGLFVSGDFAGNENCKIANANILVGGSGPDILQGSATVGVNQWLYGGPGNDNFVQGGTTTGDSNDVISGGTGVDTVNYRGRLVGAPVNVTLDGNPNDGSTGESDNVGVDVENVFTGAGPDLVVGNANSNILDAGAGTNVIQGMGGDDIFLQFVAGQDTIACGTGTDTIDYSPRNSGAVAISAYLDNTTPSGATAGGEGDILGTDCENLNGAGGGTGNQILTGNSGDNVISGGLTSGTVTIDCKGGEDIAIGDINATPPPGSISNCEIFIP